MNKRQTLAAIRRGIKRVEQVVPKARQLIDKSDLDLGYCDSCFLGQVFGTFDDGLEVLGITREEADELGFSLSGFGPETDDEIYQLEYNKLTQLWKEALS